MKFTVGYQQNTNSGESIVDIVSDYRDCVGEVYFPWVSSASGRGALGKARGLRDWDAQNTLMADLSRLREMGIKLDLLFNANCYGARAVSEELENEVGSILQYIADAIGAVDVVTTTSPFIARTVKQYFPTVETRASVNMRIGSVEAMDYVSDIFDSFYLQRDRQRDIAYVRQVKSWCDANDKKLCLLVNSGCLRNCPAQSFHDNMVAHDAEIDERKNVGGYNPHLCGRLYSDKKNLPEFLAATWIRPEDLHHYADLCHMAKLATRMHEKPRMVLHAYANASFSGNLTDLMEPGLGNFFAPDVVDNKKFPANWFTKTSQQCPPAKQYYEEVLKDVLQRQC